MTGHDSSAVGRQSDDGDQAFDLWLKRGLRKMFGSVIGEPIPEALLCLVQSLQDGAVVPERKSGGPDGGEGENV
ncbi:hypothetical protein NKW53_11355 [Acetobacter orientalis]|uniref:hypothetical protein n=1 Tax=Acetobacter orientalis TaxID=146474 RepID=UPI00209DE73E|nr:hypothetical protein [Acetobacter orientalis]MCP1216662.1 hypothetical protein [Acetobacter orientalis]MCP1219582.1 hypothetical protein [Acetobacter orientalis]